VSTVVTPFASFDIFMTLHLHAYCDAIWGSDPSNFKSLSAYCIFLGSSLIALKTKKQIVVSRSSTEAELHALGCVTAEVTWLKWFLDDFGVALSSSMPVHCDSIGTISIAQDSVKHELAKHVEWIVSMFGGSFS
jgi:hypothetical protein